MRKLVTGLMVALLLATARADSERQVLTAQWEPSGQHLAMLVGGPASLELWVLGREGQMFKQALPQRGISLVGWTPKGQIVLDEGLGGVRIVTPGGTEDRIQLPAAAVALSCNGQEAFFLSTDNRYLLAVDLNGRTRVVAPLPEGIRASATLAPDGKQLVLRRTVRSKTTWTTEIWLVKNGAAQLVSRVPASYVGVQWHPREDSLLLNYPNSNGSWGARVVHLARPKSPTVLKGLDSPVQWDSQGRLYTADATGVWSEGKAVQRWGNDVSRLKLWAVSPDGQRVLVSWETAGDRAPAYLFQVGQPGAPLVVLAP